MTNFVLLATAWGPKFGGINAFNQDFAKGLAAHLGGTGTVYCAVLSADDQDKQDARQSGVILLDLEKPSDADHYDPSWAYEIHNHPDLKTGDVDYWIGHDVLSGKAALQGASLSERSRSALIMHMDYEAYKSFQTDIGENAKRKSREQRDTFKAADYLFANGPLLAGALEDLTSRKAHRLIPGFPNVTPNPPKQKFAALTFGRMERKNDRIKQGALAVAAFGSAISRRNEQPGASGAIIDQPLMKVAGISEPGGEDEQALEALLADRAKRQISTVFTKFDEDREEHLDNIARSSVAMMVSWHEGFGLSGWEAIGAEVPLIVGKRSGIWSLLCEAMGAELAGVHVQVIDVHGQRGDDEAGNFLPEDEEAVVKAILKLEAGLPVAQGFAKELKAKLTEKYGCTWERTAADFCAGLGLRDEKPEETVEVGCQEQKLEFPPRESDPDPLAKATEPASGLIRIPESVWPKDLGIPMPDSFMLLPQSGVARFHSSRAHLRDEIVDWVTRDGPKIKLRLHAGEGGAGKTRLLLEVCKQLEMNRGWRAGFLQRDQNIAHELPLLIKEGRPAAIVVDYAETRVPEVVEVVRSLVANPPPDPFRLILLARSGGDWWDKLAESAGDNKVVAAILRQPSTKQGPYYLAKEAIQPEDRESLFLDALEDFSDATGIDPTNKQVPDLSQDHFGNPLFLHMGCLAILRDEHGLGSNELLEAVLGHERAYWRDILRARGLDPLRHLEPLEMAVAALTLTGPSDSAKSTKDLMKRVPRVGNLDPDQRNALFDIIRDLYKDGAGVIGLQPDVLGEAMVSSALQIDNELIDAAIGPEASTEQAEHALTVLTRLGRRDPGQSHWLKQAIDRHLNKRTREATNVAQETGQPMGDVLSEVLASSDKKRQRDLVKLLREVTPDETENLSEFRVGLSETHSAILKTKVSTKGRKRDIQLTQALSVLANDLARNGLLLEACSAEKQSFSFALRAFSQKKADDRARLAQAYGNLSNRLSDVGQYRPALEKAEKAEEILRGLAEAQPDAYNARWAFSLGNLSNRLSNVGQYRPALEKAEKAEEILRSLAEAQPDAYTADRAYSLNNLAGRLSDVGQYRPALEKAEKAEEILRGLAEAQPDAYNARWATSLSNLAGRLSDVGQYRLALETEKKAEEILRGLAEAQPDAYNARWVNSLSNLAERLSDVGQFQPALEKAEKAEEILRGLAEAQPDAYNADWANSLGNLSHRLSDVGQYRPALEKAEKAKEILRGLAEAQPDAYNADWATSLGNLAGRLSDVGQYRPALEKEEKAEEILRGLAEAQPDAYNARWATSLSNLADIFLRDDHADVALRLSEQAVNLHKSQLTRGEDVRDWLAFSLRSASEARLRLEDIDAAVEYTTQMADLWQEVGQDRPGREPRQAIRAAKTFVRVFSRSGDLEAASSRLNEMIKLRRMTILTGSELIKREMRGLITLCKECAIPDLDRIIDQEIVDYVDWHPDSPLEPL